MLTFFDAYCGLGQLSHPILGQEFASADELLRELAHAQIGEALVYNPASYEYDPATGNAQLNEAIAGHPNLHPCWVLLPPGTGEMPPPAELLDSMQQQGVRAARLCPSPARNNFSLAEWCSGALLAALAAAHVPLFLDQSEVSWGEIAGLLARYPDLPLVLTGVSYRLDRYLYPLWETHANLYVELSGYQGLLAVEAVVRRFGPERLLFGTNLPTYTPGAAVTMLQYADIPEADKQLIAAGNLRRLLEAAHGH
jgi:hypothetical protein